MDKEIFESILRGAEEAVAYAKGENHNCIVHHVHVPEEVDVKAIRKDLDMTQVTFADTFGFSINAVKSWETGRRQPEKAARVLLKVIAHSPEIVFEATMH